MLKVCAGKASQVDVTPHCPADEAAVAAAQEAGTLPTMVDAATVHMTLHHIHDVQKVLNSLSKLLQPGRGRLLVTDLYKHAHSKEFHGKKAHHTVAHHGGFNEAELREYVAGDWARWHMLQQVTAADVWDALMVCSMSQCSRHA